MKFIVTGLIIDFLIMLSIYPALSSDPRHEVLAYPFTLACVISFGISIIGILLIVSKKYKLGMAAMVVGCIVYLPLGFIAVLGASKLRNQFDQSADFDLASRRQQNALPITAPEQDFQITSNETVVEKATDQPIGDPVETDVPIATGQQVTPLISEQENAESSILTFSAAKFATQQRVLGTVSIIMGFIAAAFTGMGGLFVAMGIFWIVMSLTMKKDSYITLGSDFIAMKWGVRAQVNVLFNEIITVEKTPKKITLFYKNSDNLTNKDKKLVIALTVIPDEEKEQFLQVFTQRVHAINNCIDM